MDQKRMKIVFGVFLIFIFSYIIRVGYYSLYLHKPYTYLSVSQRLNLYIYDSNRGPILDRNLQPMTDRQKEIMLVYSPHLKGEEMEVALVAERLEGSADDIDFHHCVVENSIRSCGIAEHLIGLTGYSSFHKIKGMEGLSGLERQYNKELSGVPARVLMILDGNNMPVWNREPKIIEGKKSENAVVLTIDLELQEKLEKVIDDHSLIERGAVVVMNPFNGQVHSMISRPKMNYSGEDDGSHLNKTIQIHKGFNPASVFKMVTGLYALENEISPDRVFECGEMCIYNHGNINLVEGFAVSCNQVFYDLVRELGPDNIINYAQKLGLGSKTGIGLSSEGAGRLPEVSTVKGVQGNRLLAMGQGQLETTPMQIAKLTAIVANSGFDVTPNVVDYVGKNPKRVHGLRDLGSRLVGRQTVNQMQIMMEKTTQIGTARQLRGFGAVKTGTANNGNRWLTGYFPEKQPKYVVTIFIEEGFGKSTMEVTEKILKTIFD